MNNFLVVKRNGRYGALETPLLNEELEKVGFEVIDFYCTKYQALQEANRLNLAQ